MIASTLDRTNALFDRRLASRPSWVVLAELFLGIGWLRAAAAKSFERDWWTGRVITDFVEEHQKATIGWYEPIVDRVITGYSIAWAVAIIVAELAIALSLLTAKRMASGLAIAIFLNVNFLLVGAPNPSIFYLLMQLGLVLWLLETSPARRASMRWLRLLSIGGVALALVCLPYVRTMDPRMVIDDPASVLATWGSCGAVAAVVARRRVRREQLRIDLIDLTATTPTGVAVR